MTRKGGANRSMLSASHVYSFLFSLICVHLRFQFVSCSHADTRAASTRLTMILAVRHHIGRRRHAVGQVEERDRLRTGRRCPRRSARCDSASRSASSTRCGVVVSFQAKSSIARWRAIQFRDAVVQRHHLAQFGIAGQLPHRGAVRDQAVVAAVRGGNDNGDHLPLQLRQAGWRQHDLVVHRHEVAQALRLQAVGAEHVRHEAEFLDALRPDDLQVVIQIRRIRNAKRGDMIGLRHAPTPPPVPRRSFFQECSTGSTSFA